MKDEKLREVIELFRKQCINKKDGIGFEETIVRLEALIKTREIEARKDELLKADGFTEAEYTVKRLAQLESDK